MTGQKHPGGRPSGFSKAIADDILMRVSLGENIDRITQEDGYPSKPTVYAWFRQHPEFFDDYAAARAMRAESRSDRMDGIKERVLAGELAPDVARVAIDVEKWQAGKENPKKYGDKLNIGGQEDNPFKGDMSLSVSFHKPNAN